jgi:hypothetical protein
MNGDSRRFVVNNHFDYVFWCNPTFLEYYSW